MVVAAVHRVAAHVLQRVVHPAHIPLVVKTQAAGKGGPRYRGEGRRLLGQRDRLRAMCADDFVEPLEEGDRLQVFAPTMRVGDPFAGFAAVVAVQHRGDRVDPQSVDTETLDPVQRIADQVVAHLGAAEVENQRVPVGVHSLARIGVFVQMGTIEVAQPVRVAREMRRNPVEQQAKAAFMAARDETAKALGAAKARRRRVQADRLVAPGAVEGVLADGQQLEVGEAHVDGVGNQRVGQFVPVQPALRVCAVTPPGSQMHFVDADRRVERVGRLALHRRRHCRRQGVDHAGGIGSQLRGECVGVGTLRQHPAGCIAERIFVACALRDRRQKYFPHPAFAAQPHRMAPCVPVVEVADHAHAQCVGCPDREAASRHIVHARWPRAEHFERPQVGSFGQ